MSTSAGPALIDAFTADVDRLRSAEPDVRRDIPDSVHQMRVATRRLRSLLKSYRRALRRKHVDEVADELRWLAGLLGVARDAEVRADRFEELLGERGGSPVSEPAEEAAPKSGGKKTSAKKAADGEAADAKTPGKAAVAKSKDAAFSRKADSTVAAVKPKGQDATGKPNRKAAGAKPAADKPVDPKATTTPKPVGEVAAEKPAAAPAPLRAVVTEPADEPDEKAGVAKRSALTIVADAPEAATPPLEAVAEKAVSKRTAARKATVLHAVADGPAAEKTTAKKTAPRKSTTAKATAAKVTAKKAGSAAGTEQPPVSPDASATAKRTTARKARAPKPPTEAAPAKKAVAEKASPLKAVADQPAKKAARKVAAEKPAPDSATESPAPKKTPAKRPTILRAVADDPATGLVGHAPAKKTAPRKSTAAKATTAKATAAKVTAKRAKPARSATDKAAAVTAATATKAAAESTAEPIPAEVTATPATTQAAAPAKPEAQEKSSGDEKGRSGKKDAAREEFGKRLVAEERARYSAALQEAIAAFDGRRYRRLIEHLGVLTSKKALRRKQARKKAKKVFGEVLRRDFQRLRRLVRTEAKTGAKLPEAERIELLHDIRKSAKRLRYSADAATAVLGAPAADLAKHAKQLQTVLGDHRDAIEALQTLRTHAEATGEPTYQHLTAAEQSAAAEALKNYPATTKFLRHKPL